MNKVILGVCAMDVKARSKAMREILTRLVERAKSAIEVKVFGDKVITDEGEPMVVLFSLFYSDVYRFQMWEIGPDAISSSPFSPPISPSIRQSHM